jgi:hypothetical protein
VRRAGPVVRRADAAYGPSPIDLSTRSGEEIDLWIDAVRPPKWSDLQEAAYSHYALKAEITVDRRRFNV